MVAIACSLDDARNLQGTLTGSTMESRAIMKLNVGNKRYTAW
jgi:hypothetical protein